MRICVAGDGDTLVTIAKRYQVGVELLIFLNPQIESPDLSMAGRQVNLPPALSSPLRNPDQLSSGLAGETAGYPPLCPPEEPLADYLEHWLPLTPVEQMAEKEYDVLIVGTGAGGGSAIWRLCEQWRTKGKRVGVVEAGDLLLPTHAYNIPTFNAERYWRYITNPKYMELIGRSLPEYSGARRFLAVGGRTVQWGTVSPRMHSSELSKWPVTLQEMDLYYNIAEREMYVTKDYARDSSFTEILLDRIRINGFPEATYIPLAADLGQTKYGEVHSNVFFSSFIFLARALNQMPFDLAVRARVVNVITDNGSVAGVRVMTPAKQSYFLKAKNVILAANAFETPRILLNSGIQGNAIGHYLTNHSMVVARGNINTRNFPEVLGTLGILVPQAEDRPFQIQLSGPRSYYWYHYEEKPLPVEWDIGFFAGFGVVEPRIENRLSLNPLRRDEYGVPEIQINFSYSERDQAIIRRVAFALRQVASATGIRLIQEHDQPDICLLAPGLDNHECGTCRMGDDPSTSATNRYGQIHGVSGLYVTDNSVLPSLGAANPTLTTVALAIRTADYIVEQLK